MLAPWEFPEKTLSRNFTRIGIPGKDAQKTGVCPEKKLDDKKENVNHVFSRKKR